MIEISNSIVTVTDANGTQHSIPTINEHTQIEKNRTDIVSLSSDIETLKNKTTNFITHNATCSYDKSYAENGVLHLIIKYGGVTVAKATNYTLGTINNSSLFPLVEINGFACVNDANATQIKLGVKENGEIYMYSYGYALTSRQVFINLTVPLW